MTVYSTDKSALTATYHAKANSLLRNNSHKDSLISQYQKRAGNRNLSIITLLAPSNRCNGLHLTLSSQVLTQTQLISLKNRQKLALDTNKVAIFYQNHFHFKSISPITANKMISVTF